MIRVIGVVGDLEIDGGGVEGNVVGGGMNDVGKGSKGRDIVM